MMSFAHGRMPLIVDPRHYELWLDPRVHDRHRLLPLLAPYRWDLQVDLQVHLVANPVDDPGLDDTEYVRGILT